MAKTVLFISDISNSFFLNSIISGVEKSGYDCELVEYDVNSIEVVRKEIAAYFMFVSAGTATRNHANLVYLNSKCKSMHQKIFLIGDPADINAVKGVLEPDVIWEVFERPINVSEVINKTVKDFEEDQKNDNRLSILLVDDSGTVLHTMKQWLEPMYKVTMVNSAASGMTFLGKHRPDLILLDYEMPVCDGPQMLAMIRSDARIADIPVFFLTGKGDRESIEKVLALKPEGYLLKSLPKEKILENLQNFFRR